MKNYHTHTTRCNHASGNDEEYVQNAIKSGFDTLGFSDHAPMLFDHRSYYSGFRMRTNQAGEYINSIKSLKQSYKSELDIHIGFEIEYYKKCFDKTVSMLDELGSEYYILGQHFTDNEFEPYAHYSGNKTKSITVFDKYIEQALTGLQTGKFIYIAHPDLFNFTGRDDVYVQKMTYFLNEIKKLGYPIEFNLLGYGEKRNYPNKLFWELAAEVGNDVVIGFDAHKPSVLSDSETYNSALNYLEKLNISPIEIEL